jgi:sigma-B regulation protein RsbU (phosphoserine phosphatase)
MPKIPGIDIAAGFRPAREVAGDFYDLFVKQDEKLMLAIADAAGKGVPACLYSLCVRSMLRSFDDSFTELPEVIARTNNLFCLDTGESGVFVTAWVGVYDAKKRTLDYSCCGHPPAILKHKDGSFEELSTEGMALGVIPFDEVKAKSISLSSGDTVVLFTDGLLEAHDPDGRLFGKERLLDWLRTTEELSAEQMIESLFKKLAQFAYHAPQHDDQTLLVLKIC